VRRTIGRADDWESGYHTHGTRSESSTVEDRQRCLYVLAYVGEGSELRDATDDSAEQGELVQEALLRSQLQVSTAVKGRASKIRTRYRAGSIVIEVNETACSMLREEEEN
jgi:hypothetical protein